MPKTYGPVESENRQTKTLEKHTQKELGHYKEGKALLIFKDDFIICIGHTCLGCSLSLGLFFTFNKGGEARHGSACLSVIAALEGQGQKEA